MASAPTSARVRAIIFFIDWILPRPKCANWGAEYPYPAPVLMAYASAIGEVCFPVLLVLGLGTRYAALGLMGMTAIIQLTVPDGWQNFHLPWALMELAILTFGPGKIALDYVLGLDQVSSSLVPVHKRQAIEII